MIGGMIVRLITAVAALGLVAAGERPEGAAGEVPKAARLVFEEDWSSGRIDAEHWYPLRKRWGEGNNGVVPENISVAKDVVRGKERNVLMCVAHGDRYEGAVIGEG